MPIDLSFGDTIRRFAATSLTARVDKRQIVDSIDHQFYQDSNCGVLYFQHSHSQGGFMEFTRRAVLAAPLAIAAATTIGQSTPAYAQSEKSLRIAHVFLPATLNPATDGFNLVEQGLAECLTRVNQNLQVEPWLAESVVNIDSTTWEVRLRANAAFWDGSPVNAEAVLASFAMTWETQPDAANFIDPSTAITVVDDVTLRFVTATAVGSFPNNLASFHFIIRKAGADDTFMMTGPYKPSRLIPDQVLELTANVAHWAGQPSASAIVLTLTPDANTRALALQSGDTDFISQVPPELVDTLPENIATEIVANTRVHSMIFNFASPLVTDAAIRSAINMSIDRANLNDIGLNGQGVVTTGPFPASFGVASPLAETPSVAEAQALLDAAGWTIGSNGIRSKGEQQLKLLVASYPNRAELTPMAIAMQDQLKAIGIEIEVREVEDISSFLESEEWDASMWSFNPLPTGDPLYLFNTSLVTDGIFNPGKYSNPDLDALAAALKLEADPAIRTELTATAQDLVVSDAACVWLLSPPRAFAFNLDVVASYSASPNDLYMIDETLILTN